MNQKIENKKIKLIYLMGMGRSGGTLVGKILGQIEDTTFVGEIRHLIDRGFKENWECSCGDKFKDCKHWRKIFIQTFLNNEKVKLSDFIRIQESFDRTTMIIKTFWILIKIKIFKHNNKELNIYKNLNSKLYHNISESFKTNNIIESSRYPGRALMLNRCDDIDLFIIHLVRDPRGVINSQLKKQQERTGKKSKIALRNILTWNITLFIGYIIQLIFKKSNITFLCYENFIKRPHESLQRILNEANLSTKKLPEFSSENAIHIKPVHVFSGNENRYLSGEIIIKHDIKWKKELNCITKFIVTLSTFYYLMIQFFLTYDRKTDE